MLFKHLKLPSPPVKVSIGYCCGQASVERWNRPFPDVLQVQCDPRMYDIRFRPLVRLLSVQAGSVHASTSAEVLEGLLGKHPVVATVLEFRGVNKYKTT